MKKEQQESLNRNRGTLEIVLSSKLEELHMLGYENITKEVIWDCLIERVWRNTEEERSIHMLVNDVLSLSASDCMNYLSFHMYKDSPDFFKQFEENEIGIDS
jgi:hypothetical protein